MQNVHFVEVGESVQYLSGVLDDHSFTEGAVPIQQVGHRSTCNGQHSLSQRSRRNYMIVTYHSKNRI